MALMDGPMSVVAKTLVGVFGVSATLQRHIGNYDELQGKEIELEDVEFTLKVTPPAEYSKYDVASSRTAAGPSSIEATDLKVIAATGLFPTGLTDIDPKTDRLVIGGVNYRIISKRLITSGSNTPALELQLRA